MKENRFTSRKFIVFIIATILFTAGIFIGKETITASHWFILAASYGIVQGGLDGLKQRSLEPVSTQKIEEIVKKHLVNVIDKKANKDSNKNKEILND